MQTEAWVQDASESMRELALGFVRSGAVRWPQVVDSMPDHECEVFLSLVEMYENDARLVR